MALITPVKAVNKTTASPNDVLLYTMILSNTGLINALNVVVVDTLPTGITFINGSLKVNGTTVTGSPVPPGYAVGTIVFGTTATLTFQAYVATVPISPITLTNFYTASYISIPITTPEFTSDISNSVITTIPTASLINTKKAVNKEYVDIGDFITYTITVPNTGEVEAGNIIFKDTLPFGTSYVANSFLLNSTSLPGADPQVGVNIGTILSGGIATINFSVQVVTVPTINPMPNTGRVYYNSYGVTPTSNSSNTVQTQVNNGDLNIIKSVDFSHAKPTQTLTYTILLSNRGSTSSNNVYFSDTLPLGATFVANSLKLNGATLTGVTPDSLINIGTISAGSYSIVTFMVTVDTPPSVNPILNSATTSYSYLIDPSIPISTTKQKVSNITVTDINTLPLETTIPNIAAVDFQYVVDPSTPIVVAGTVTTPEVDNFLNSAIVSESKTVDKLYANVLDTITYTVVLTNSGTTSANNVIFRDTIPNDTSFVAGSVAIDGSIVAGSPAPPTGIAIGTISSGGVSTVTFQITVNTIPSPNPIPNESSSSYTFTVVPTNPNSEVGTTISNTVNTQINNANLTLTKIPNLAYADVGNTITYTIVVRNVGNVSATSISFTDTIPNDTTFVADSVAIDGSIVVGSPAPPTGINIGTVAAGTVRTVTFQVTVNTLPSPNPISNNSTTSYNFTVDPSVPNGVTAGDNSNEGLTQVNHAYLTMNKSTNLNYADVGNTITYTVIIKNVGNVSANNVRFIDTLPNGTAFVANSVNVNGTTIVGSPVPPNGVNIGTIPVGAVSTVTFNVLVTTLPTPTTIVNAAFSNFRYTVNPSVPNGGFSTGNSNDVITQINTATLSMLKISSPRAGTIGTTITYTVTIANSGNVSANNIIFTDTIPNDTTFVADSMAIDGSIVSGSPAPPSGINIGTISSGVVRTVTFQVVVDTIPTPNPLENSAVTSFSYTVDPSVPNGVIGNNLSNIVYTPIRKPYILMTKSAVPQYGIEGTTITYTIIVENYGNIDANDVVFTDTIPNDTIFVDNSVTVNGTSVPGSPAPPTGISLTTIALNTVTTVTFAVVINTLPSPNPIPNSAVTNYKFTVDPSFPNADTGSNLSNIVTVQYNKAQLEVTKLSDMNYADIGYTITYTVVLKNTGNVPANNVRFFDTIPNYTTFVPGSLDIDGNPVIGSPAPPDGVTIPIILGGDASTVTFQVVVDTIPTPNPLQNSAVTSYTYTIDPSVPNGGSGANNSNINNVQINNANLNLFKVGTPTYVDVGTTITYTVVINNVGNVAATSVNFIDTIPNDTTFVAGSIAIDGSIISGSPAPPSGVNIGTVPGSTVETLTFQVVVNTIPSPNPILNSSYTSYNYTVDPSLVDGANGSENSNISQNQVNNANLKMVKSAIPSFADIGTTISYTIVISNVGNVAATSINFTDTIPIETTFVADSMAIDGSIVSGSPVPPTGLDLGTMVAGTVSTLTFKVVVNTIPSPNPIINIGTTSYNYTVDPSEPNGVTGIDNSNTTEVQVNNANLTMSKVGSPSYADVGTTITYTIIVSNLGNVAATNIDFTDTIPNDTTFVVGSMAIDGSIVSGSPAPSGINIGTIAGGTVSTITFEVVVNTIPSPNPILNAVTTSYNYTVDPSFPNGASGSENSNVSENEVNNANLIMNKVGSPSFADVGTTITYTIVISNVGNVAATSINFMDTIPNDTSFVAGSMAIDGSIVSGSPSPSGINIGTIAGGTVSTITFDVVVNTIPSPNPILNSSTTSYNYTVDPSVPNGVNGGDNSNISQNQVNNANLTMSKVGSPSFVAVGTTITYTIVLSNVGNVAATSINFTDTIPNDTTFVVGSMAIDGSIVSGSPAPSGINIGTIAGGTVSTITFDVVVNTIPSPNPILNSATTNYNYTVDPSFPNGASGSENSNVSENEVNNANLIMNKTSSPSFADVGTTITYTIELRNVGNVTATSINFTDTIPNDTTFVVDSMAIDGSVVSGSPAPSGINIGTIASGTVSTITFEVVVNTIPSPNPILNEATTSYNYTTDPSFPNGATGGNNSNTSENQVNNANLTMEKAGSPSYADVGTTITYTIVLSNVGNVAATSINFTDTIPNDTTFVLGSMAIDGSIVTGSPVPPTGVNIGTIAAGTVATVTFDVIVNTIPSPNPILNASTTSYNYTVDPSIPNGGTGVDNSNISENQVNNANLIMNKTGSPSYADVGTTITYTIVLSNVGNVDANDVIFTDTITNDTTFVVDSLAIDGSIITGSPVPPTGVNIGTIAAGTIATVTFDVVVDTIPSPNPILNDSTTSYNYTVDPSVPNGGTGGDNSNTSENQVNNANLIMNKTGSTSYADVGTTITYTIVLSNVGNVAATSINFTDTIPNDTTFVAGSMAIDGSIVSGSPVPPTGINIGTIAGGSVSTVTFDIVVDTIPSPNPILNAALTNYNYTVDPSFPNGVIGGDNSNTDQIQVNHATLTLNKLASLDYADVGNTITYTVIVKNNGNVSANNVRVIDTIPDGTVFIANSVSLDGTSIVGSPVPPNGVNIGTVPAGTVATVTFDVLVLTLPSPSAIVNSAYSNFRYTVNPSVPNGGFGVNYSNGVITNINTATLSMNKISSPLAAKVGTTITYTVVVRNLGNVSANNITFIDTIPNDTTLLTNSVKVNGVTVVGSITPPTGINIGTIVAGGVSTVTFKVVVNTLPSPNPLENAAITSFSYTVNPSVPNGTTGNNISNTIFTPISRPYISLIKSAFPTYGTDGTIILYSVAMTNYGNIDANNVIFTDTIPNDTTFVANSVTVNGSTVAGSVAPPIGINLRTIAVGVTKTLTFAVVINTLPSPNPIPNSAVINYDFIVSESLFSAQSVSNNSDIISASDNSDNISLFAIESGSNVSNIVYVYYNKAQLELTKLSNVNYADVSSTVTYTIVLKNTGNVSANNVRFIDTIPNGTSFIDGSLEIDDIPVIGSVAPPDGVTIPTILAGDASTVTFKVMVDTIPIPNPAPNAATASFNFTIDPSLPNGGLGGDNSNTNNVQVNNANLIMSKVSNPSFADLGNTITYTIVLNNVGNVEATNITFTDTIPQDAIFIAGSLAIDGSIVSGSPAPPTGISIGTIAGGTVSTVTFEVVVNTIPSPNPITNSAINSYNYTVDPSVPNGASGGHNSNIAETQVNHTDITLKKLTNLQYADIGSVITYTVLASNTGNVSANNVRVIDTLPDGTTFVANSVTVNGITIAGSPVPPNGVNIGTVAVGSVSTVTFNVLVVTLPSPNEIVNTAVANFRYTVNPSVPNQGFGVATTTGVSTKINTATLAMNKISVPLAAAVGSTITYIVAVNNQGNTVANNITFTDTIPNGTNFILGSMAIDGSVVAGSPVPPSGVNIGTIAPGSVSTVTFDVFVNTLPSPNPLQNSAVTSFSYTVDPSVLNGVIGNNISNIVYTPIGKPYLLMTKSSAPEYGIEGTTITYTIAVNNYGNADANDVIFTDTIPNDTTFVSNSVTVNGVTVAGNPEPPTGISLSTIPLNTVTTLTFAVVINTLPSPNPILNSAVTAYKFTVDPSFPNGETGNNISNISTVQYNKSELEITKLSDSDYADVGSTITYTIVLKNTGNVSANNVRFVDTIPNDTTFVVGSLEIDDNPVAGSVLPPDGVTIPIILGQDASTVTFKVIVTTMPSPNPISNTASARFEYTIDPSVVNGGSGYGNSNSFETQINHAQLISTKTSSRSYASCGTVIKYSITVENTGNIPAINILFKDTIPNGTEFINNSVTVNGITVPGGNPSTGVSVGTIASGAISTVTFSVTVIC